MTGDDAVIGGAFGVGRHCSGGNNVMMMGDVQ
jgi:hypothetical protein